jgi:hypothetical protein
VRGVGLGRAWDPPRESRSWVERGNRRVRISGRTGQSVKGASKGPGGKYPHALAPSTSSTRTGEGPACVADVRQGLRLRVGQVSKRLRRPRQPVRCGTRLLVRVWTDPGRPRPIWRPGSRRSRVRRCSRADISAPWGQVRGMKRLRSSSSWVPDATMAPAPIVMLIGGCAPIPPEGAAERARLEAAAGECRVTFPFGRRDR